MNTTPRSRHARDLIIAGAMLAISAALVFLTPDHISRDLAQRVLNVMLGAFVVFYANEAPKLLPRRLGGRCDSSEYQSLRRFAGWTLVLGGVAYALAWILAPIDLAAPVAVGLLGTAFLIVVARYVLTRQGTRS